MTKTDPFAAYVMPLGLSEGVVIPLPNTPAQFTVLLPGTMNEEFNMDVIAAVSGSAIPDEDGRVKLNGAKLQKARRAAFFSECIISAKGLPDDMPHDEFFKKYPMAARILFDEASRLAVLADDEAAALLEKLKPTQPGKRSGEAKNASITT